MGNKNEEFAKLIEFNGDAEQRKNILEIANIAQEVLKEERHINISMAKAIPTIVYEYLLACVQFLEKNKSTNADITLNIMDIMDMGITYRESEDGEKTGNFTPFLLPGTVFKTTIKSDELSEDED